MRISGTEDISPQGSVYFNQPHMDENESQLNLSLMHTDAHLTYRKRRYGGGVVFGAFLLGLTLATVVGVVVLAVIENPCDT